MSDSSRLIKTNGPRSNSSGRTRAPGTTRTVALKLSRVAVTTSVSDLLENPVNYSFILIRVKNYPVSVSAVPRPEICSCQAVWPIPEIFWPWTPASDGGKTARRPARRAADWRRATRRRRRPTATDKVRRTIIRLL